MVGIGSDFAWMVFFRQVKKMRASQRKFYRTKSSLDLKTALSIEREIDRMIEEIDAPPSLFPSD